MKNPILKIRLICILMFGLLVGSILTTKGYEATLEFTPLTWWDKLKIIFDITVIMVLPYLAGREDMKEKLK